MNLEGQPETQRWCLVRKASHLREVEAESRKSLGEHNWPVSHGAFSEHHKQTLLGPRWKAGERCWAGSTLAWAGRHVTWPRPLSLAACLGQPGPYPPQTL